MLDTSAAGTYRRDGRGSTAPVAIAVSSPGYAIGSDAADRDRLRSQTDELNEHTDALLERVGIQSGAEGA